jgi:PAS domain-containing protein
VNAPSSLHIHEVAINAITEMVSVVGEDGSYRPVNDAWCASFLLRRDDVRGHPREAIVGHIAGAELARPPAWPLASPPM